MVCLIDEEPPGLPEGSSSVTQRRAVTFWTKAQLNLLTFAFVTNAVPVSTFFGTFLPVTAL